MRRPPLAAAARVCLLLSLAPAAAAGQGLPAFAPINPAATSRSTLGFEPYHDPAPGRWRVALGVEYASTIESNPGEEAWYLLDSELLRLQARVVRDLGARTFLLAEGGIGGAYAGFLDGFLEWYHGLLGIRIAERDARPKNAFAYEVALADGTLVQRDARSMLLTDLRLGLGFRHTRHWQTLLSVTLPTNTGPEGYGIGTVAVGAVNTVRVPLSRVLLYEGSLGVGLTPSHGALEAIQRETFVSASSGLRLRFWGRQALFANLFYHSPYYRDSGLPALDRRDLELDFGWVLAGDDGRELRIGMTEDMEPGGPGIDLIFRVGGKL